MSSTAASRGGKTGPQGSPSVPPQKSTAHVGRPSPRAAGDRAAGAGFVSNAFLPGLAQLLRAAGLLVSLCFPTVTPHVSLLLFRHHKIHFPLNFQNKRGPRLQSAELAL